MDFSSYRTSFPFEGKKNNTLNFRSVQVLIRLVASKNRSKIIRKKKRSYSTRAISPAIKLSRAKSKELQLALHRNQIQSHTQATKRKRVRKGQVLSNLSRVNSFSRSCPTKAAARITFSALNEMKQRERERKRAKVKIAFRRKYKRNFFSIILYATKASFMHTCVYQKFCILFQLKNAFSKLDGELKGRYYPLADMDEATKQRLIDDHFLFKEGDRFLQDAQACRFWPSGE